jgi:lysophospholipase L1-like esterase
MLRARGYDAQVTNAGVASVNLSQIIQRLKARGIKVIIANMQSAAADVGPDGQHLTAHGQTVVAERLLPQVVGAIGRR